MTTHGHLTARVAVFWILLTASQTFDAITLQPSVPMPTKLLIAKPRLGRNFERRRRSKTLFARLGRHFRAAGAQNAAPKPPSVIENIVCTFGAAF